VRKKLIGDIFGLAEIEPAINYGFYHSSELTICSGDKTCTLYWHCYEPSIRPIGRVTLWRGIVGLPKRTASRSLPLPAQGRREDRDIPPQQHRCCALERSHQPYCGALSEAVRRAAQTPAPQIPKT
jgi:hypothetical protein